MRNPEKIVNPESNLVYPNLSKCQLTLMFMFSLFVSGGFFEYVFQNPSITKNSSGKCIATTILLYNIHLRPTVGVGVGVGVEEVGTARK